MSETGGIIKIKNNIAKEVIIMREGKKEKAESELFVIETGQGERITIMPVG